MNKIYKNIEWLPKNAEMEIILNDRQDCHVTSVFCFIFSEDKSKIFLMENVNKTRGLDVPGGHIEEEETEMEALKREVLEEVGLSIKDIRYVGCQKITKDIPEERYPHLISSQNFYAATVEKVVTDILEVDSLERVEFGVEEYRKYLKSTPNSYYRELFESSIS